MKSGFVALAGRPNVGKSTLLNALIGEKVAIVSDRPQTTRRVVRGVRTTAGCQMVFVDTPGVHRPRTLLGERLNSITRGTIAEVDVGVLVVDAVAGVGRGDSFVASWVLAASLCSIVAVNKIDAASRDQVASALVALLEVGEFDEFVPVSAASGAGVELLASLVSERLPEGPPFYPDDTVTDTPIEVRVGEIVREKFLAQLDDELPHSLAVVVDDMYEDDAGTVHVQAKVLVERDSQKGIVIGRGASVLKLAGKAAREELELLLGAKVFLDLRVSVERDWQRRPKGLARLGF